MAFKLECEDGVEREFLRLAETKSANGAIRKTRHIEDSEERAYSMVEIAYEKFEDQIELFDELSLNDLVKFFEIFMGGLDPKA